METSIEEEMNQDMEKGFSVLGKVALIEWQKG